MSAFKKVLILFFILTLSSFAAIRIMPLGNSITYDDTYADIDNPRPAGKRSGYRNYLWYKLEDAGIDADFVGSQVAGQDIRPPFDPENEGHPGWTSYDIAEHTYEYMVNSQPDIVLLHIGTNDRTSTNPDGIASILNEIERYEAEFGKHVRVFVALIIDRREPDGRIAIFNDRLREMLEDRIAQGDDIVIVDMYHTAGLTPSDYTDHTHPNNDGYYKMANVWFNALIQHIDFNQNIRAFPTSVVPRDYIVNISYDDEKGIVTFTAEIPDGGIQF